MLTIQVDKAGQAVTDEINAAGGKAIYVNCECRRGAPRAARL
jgi:hypothetical protein